MRKVALLMQSAANGGVQRIMINLVCGMIEEGVDVDFLIADARGEMRKQIPKECCVYDFKKMNYRGDLKVFFSLFQIAKYMRENRGTVIYAAPGLSCTVVAFLKIFYSDVKVVLINDNKCSLLKEGGLYHKVVYCINKLVYRYADKVIAAHTLALKDIAKHYNIETENLTMIYHPLIDTRVIEATYPETSHPFVRSKEAGYKLLLAVGRLVPEKAFEDLIVAISIVRKENKVKLLILGEGEQREQLQKAIEHYHLQEDVCLFGYTDRVYSFMKSADLFVLSSRQEAFGNVLVEAIACGLPCVATDCKSGGPREILENVGKGPYGVLCPYSDVRKMAYAIMEAMNQSYDLAQFRKKAALFTIEYATSQYLNLFEEPKNE